MTGQSILDLMNANTSEMIVAESFVLASEFTSPYWGTIVGGGLGSVRVTGNIELQNDQVFMPASAPFVIDGVISGPGHLEVGRGFEQAVVLTNPSNSFTGGLSVTQGVLRAGNSLAFGTFNDLAVAAGTTLDIGETFQAISNFSCAGTMNAAVRTGELFVRGSIALSNCVLNTSSPGGYIPQSQEVMTMIENVTGASFGAFVGYPEGTSINVNGVNARATYHAGDSGNNFAFVAEIIPVSNVSARTPPQSVARGAVANALVAMGLDQWNRPAPNARITFTAPVGCGSFGGSQSAQAFTDAQGLATAPPFTASGVSQVCLVTAQGDAGGSATFEVHSYAPAEVTMATIPTALNTIVNQPFTLAAELRGANGMSLPGLAVTFQVVMRGNAGGGNAGASLPAR
jgi:autotransporter-associated beta strand protein